jgi:hypothetical protein
MWTGRVSLAYCNTFTAVEFKMDTFLPFLPVLSPPGIIIIIIITTTTTTIIIVAVMMMMMMMMMMMVRNVKTKIIPVIIGATGTISQPFRKYLSNIPGKHEIQERQETVILVTAHVLQKALM